MSINVSQLAKQLEQKIPVNKDAADAHSSRKGVKTPMTTAENIDEDMKSEGTPTTSNSVSESGTYMTN